MDIEQRSRALRKLILSRSDRANEEPFLFTCTGQREADGRAKTAAALNHLERLARRWPGTREQFQLQKLRDHRKAWW